MKIKTVALFLVAVFLLAGCVSTPSSGIPVNFHYLDKPDICFFPKAQAKWDGYQITNKNWNKLDAYLKLMFIVEAVQELEAKNTVRINMTDSSRTLRALDYGIDKINRDAPQAKILVIDFLNDVLKEAKMVTPRQIRVR